MLLTLWSTLPLCAQRVDDQIPAHQEKTHIVGRTILFGIGKNHLYDSYLSPLDYTGPTLSFTRIGERKTTWAEGRITWMTLFDLNATLAQNPEGNGSTIDAEAQFDAGWHYNFTSSDGYWRWAIGGLAALHSGGTYNSRNGNNPAQGRGAFDRAASVLLNRRFHLWKHRLEWRTQLDIPMVGIAFSPNYGQSYYEIFELGHTDHNLCFTYPRNAPSARLITTLTLPMGLNSITFGYKADIRQSSLNHLDRHAWNHALVIGYSRVLQILPR